MQILVEEVLVEVEDMLHHIEHVHSKKFSKNL